MTRTVVTVDGIDGSGKSTFATRLIAALIPAGVHAVLARVDDYRQVLDWNQGDEETLYYERYYALAELGRTVDAFAAGAMALSLPSFDGLAGRPEPPRTVEIPPASVLVIEGVFIRRIPIGSARVIGVYLDVPETVARARLVARDVRRGRPIAEIEHRLNLRYVPGRRRYHREWAPREHAALIVDNASTLGPRLTGGDLDTTPDPVRHALLDILTPGPR